MSCKINVTLTMLWLIISTVSSMMNRLHGQPESYDKKSVISSSRARFLTCLRQVKLPIRQDTRRWHIWNCTGSRWPQGEMRGEDNPQEECQGQRTDGLR